MRTRRSSDVHIQSSTYPTSYSDANITNNRFRICSKYSLMSFRVYHGSTNDLEGISLTRDNKRHVFRDFIAIIFHVELYVCIQEN